MAAGLVAAGADVRATDVVDLTVPETVRFRVEDVTTVDTGALTEFHDVDAVYALNCPPDLHRPILDLARALSVPFLFTTLGYDQPAVPVRRETLIDDDGRPFTLFVADAAHPDARKSERESR